MQIPQVFLSHTNHTTVYIREIKIILTWEYGSGQAYCVRYWMLIGRYYYSKRDGGLLICLKSKVFSKQRLLENLLKHLKYFIKPFELKSTFWWILHLFFSHFHKNLSWLNLVTLFEKRMFALVPTV